MMLVNHPDKPGTRVAVECLVHEYVKTNYGDRYSFLSAEGYQAACMLVARDLAQRLSEEDRKVLDAYTHHEGADLQALLFEDAEARREAHRALYGNPLTNS